MTHIYKSNIITAVDVGSTHVTAAVAEVSSSTSMIGLCRMPHSGGAKRGMIVNLQAISNAFQDALDEIERQSGLHPNKIRISCYSENSKFDKKYVSTKIQSDEVEYCDVTQLRADAQSSKWDTTHSNIHLIPSRYVVDSTNDIDTPIGLIGTTLSSTFFRISALRSEIQIRNKLCQMQGLVLEQVVDQGLASASSTLTFDEKDIGICSINIGYQSTHVVVHTSGYPVYRAQYPIGSEHITRDISIAFHTSLAEAERLKREFGLGVQSVDCIEIQTIESVQTISTSALQNVIRSRATEILEHIFTDLNAKSAMVYAQLGFVLTGGGALLSGFCLLGESIFHRPCRLGLPLDITGVTLGTRTPQITTCVGMLNPAFGNIFCEVQLPAKRRYFDSWKEKLQAFF